MARNGLIGSPYKLKINSIKNQALCNGQRNADHQARSAGLHSR